MIIIDIINDKPQDETGQAVAQDVIIKTIPDQPLDDYCLCDLGLSVCEYTEMAFYGGSNKFESDYTSLFVNKVDQTDLIEFYLIDVSTGAEIILEDSNAADYGVYSESDNHKAIEIDFTTLKASFPDLILMKLKTVQTVFGTTVERVSHQFNLVKWNPERADGTVRIESINSGRIESGNDYDSLNWRRSIRMRGRIAGFSPDLQTDNYLDGERIIKQIQDKIETEYTLETELLPSAIFSVMIYNDLLANEISISDYNLQNVNYKGLKVAPKSIVANDFPKNQNGQFEIVFTKRKQNDIKRNV